MDLREMLQRRIAWKKQLSNTNASNSNRPDPPVIVAGGVQQNSNDHDHTNDVKKKNNIIGSIPSDSTALNRSRPKQQQQQPIELGTIHYCNITPDGRHGDYNTVLQISSQNVDKPIFVNFVEWLG